MLYFEHMLPSEKDSQNTINLLFALLCFFGANLSLDWQRAAGDVPSTVELVTQLWLMEPPQISVDMDSNIFYIILGVEEAPKRLNSVVSAMPGRNVATKAMQVALLAISQLNIALVHAKYGCQALVTHIRVLLAITSSHKHPLKHAVILSNRVTCVTQALVCLSSFPLDQNIKDLACSIMECFFLLLGMLECTNAITWIKQSLHAGLFIAIVRCAPWIEQFSHLEINPLSEIISILSTYLVYHSVIKKAESSITQVDTPKFQAIIKDTPIAQQWSEYKLRLFKMISIKKSYHPTFVCSLYNVCASLYC